MKNFLSILAAAALLSGCAGHQIPELNEIKPVAPVMSEPLPPQTPGSLWSESRGGLFQDIKARTVGDIVTVAIYESARASKEAITETDRTSSMSAGISKLFGLERNIGYLNGAIDPTSLVNAKTSNVFEGNGLTERTEDLAATLSTQIVEVLPNGNLRIEGNKTVTVNSETQIVKLTGQVRPSDISADNIVDSKNVLNSRIAYYGEGVVSDKQQPGWLVQALDQVWPF
jgi:flagellar L-ring protein precursor FlgH